jgi:hypothetical protein
VLLTAVLTSVAVLAVSGGPNGVLVHGVPIVRAVAVMGEILLGYVPSGGNRAYADWQYWDTGRDALAGDPSVRTRSNRGLRPLFRNVTLAVGG